MAVYKFRLTFEDHEDVARDIEILSTHTFRDLQSAIHESIGFDLKHEGSFYMSDDQWKKGKEISSADKKSSSGMDKGRLSDYILDPHQKIIYVYDFSAMWFFFIELLKIQKPDQDADYPRCVKKAGEAPKQYQLPGDKKAVIPAEDEIAPEFQQFVVQGEGEDEDEDEHALPLEEEGEGGEGEGEGEVQDDDEAPPGNEE